MPSTPNSSTPSGGSFMKCEPSMIEGEATLAVNSVARPSASRPLVIRVTEAGRSAEIHRVDLDPAGGDARDLGEDALRRALGLRADRDLGLAFAHPGGAVERLHARMREIRRLVFGLDFLRRRRGLGVAFVAADRPARGGAGRKHFRNALRGKRGVRAVIPLDLERVAAELRRPVAIG